MKPSTRKAMRVATTFTGATACAFAFAPNALAGTLQAAPQPGHNDRAVRVNVNTIHNIQNANCRGGNQSHWFHMGTTGSVTCFGFTGTAFISPPFFISAECGGNNFGYISGSGPTGHRRITWHQGTTYRNLGPFSVSVVHISGFNGTQKCPLFP